MYKNKPVFPSPLLFAAILMLFLSACSFSPAKSEPPQTDEFIADGTFTGSKFTHTEVLNDRNGSTFNFYVKNNGKTDVEISINGKHKRTIAAGKEGHISETLGFLNKSYECVAKAAVDGEEIDIYWAVAVRD